MGVNAIEINHATGDPIEASHINELGEALSGDFIGRNASGSPAEAQNLGNATTPWGTIFCSDIIVDGNRIETDQLSVSPNRILEDAGLLPRPYNRRPEYLNPDGGLNLRIRNLRCTINNTLVEIGDPGIVIENTTPFQSGIGSCNPASGTDFNHLRDTFEDGRDGTNLYLEGGANWQNYFQGQIGKRVGFNLFPSNAVGWNACTGIANYDATTGKYFLSNCELNIAGDGEQVERIYDYVQSDSDIVRGTFNNAGGIEFILIGYIFLDVDGSTVTVTYNEPIYSASPPSGTPEVNDFWFQLSSQRWFQYDGANWIQVEKAFIGRFFNDTAVCRAARPLHLSAKYSNESTLSRLRIDESAKKVLSMNSRDIVSVYGNTIDSGNRGLEWDIEDLVDNVDPTDVYYLTLTNEGDRLITRTLPQYIQELKGYYKWRDGFNQRYLAKIEILPEGTGKRFNVTLLDSPMDNFVGTIFIWPSNDVPKDCLICDGSELDIHSYPDLFNRIGWNYGRTRLGAGDTETDFDLFRIPDLRGLFLRGKQYTSNRDQDDRSQFNNGATDKELGTRQADALQNHVHGYNQATWNVRNTSETTGSSAGFNANSENEGSDRITMGAIEDNPDFPSRSSANETRPKNIYVNFIIKYK